MIGSARTQPLQRAFFERGGVVEALGEVIGVGREELALGDDRCGVCLVHGVGARDALLQWC